MILLFLYLSLFSVKSFAQTNAQIVYVTTAPSGSCQARTNLRLKTPNGTLYTCQNGTWGIISGGGGNCTVAGSNGDLQMKSGSGCAASHVNDDGTKVSITEPVSVGASPPATTGTGIIGLGETTGQTCPAGGDCILADSASHSLKLSNNGGTAAAILFSGGALGTPSSGTLTNATGLPIAGLTGLGTGVATALAANVSGSGAICLASGSACGGGGGGTRSFNIPIGGGFVNTSPAPAVSGVGTGIMPDTNSGLGYSLALQMSATCGSTCTAPDPFVVVNFWIPQDFSSGLAISLFIVDSGGSGGNTRWNYGLTCQTSGSAWSTSYTNTSQSATTAFTGFGATKLVAATAIATSGCSAGSQATLRISRDDTVSSNSGGYVGLVAVQGSYAASY